MIADVTVDNIEMTINKPFFVKENHAVHITDEKTGNVLINEYIERSSHVTDEEYLSKKYNKFVKELLPGYFRAISGPYGNNIFFRGFNFICMRKFSKFMFR